MMIFALGGILFLASGVGVVAWHKNEVTSAYEKGRESVKQEAAASVAVLEERLRASRKVTDTIWKSVERQTTSFDTLYASITDTVWFALPDTVKQTIQSCVGVRNACDAFRAAVVLERLQSDSAREVASVSLVASKDSIRDLIRRPSRKKAWGLAAIAATAGFLSARR